MSSKNWQLVEQITMDHAKRQILNELERLKVELESEHPQHSHSYLVHKTKLLEKELRANERISGN